MKTLPLEFTNRIKVQLGGELESFLRCYERPHYRGLHINTLKYPLAKASELPFELEQAPFAKQGFYLKGEEQGIGRHPLHHAGAFYVQEPSAMYAVTALAPQSGDKVLDLCAAPGGKSMQLAAALEGAGLLWSNEIVPKRANILLSNAERMGVRNAVISSEHPQRLAERLRGFFDKVLVDAPCSGEGMFRREPAAVSEWSSEHVKACALRQLAILQSAAECLREGGVLVYSTCTFSPDENEGVITQFLEENPDFALEAIQANAGRSCGSSAMQRIWPMDVGEGHFVAKLKRNSPNPCVTAPFSFKADSQATELFEACFVNKIYGNVHIHRENALILPKELPELQGLKILRAGVLLGELKKKRIEPAHAVFMASKPQECRRSIDLPMDSLEIAKFLSGEELSAEGTANGWAGVSVQGLVTGFGKVSNGILKNKYPKGLRN